MKSQTVTLKLDPAETGLLDQGDIKGLVHNLTPLSITLTFSIDHDTGYPKMTVEAVTVDPEQVCRGCDCRVAVKGYCTICHLNHGMGRD